MHSETKSKKNKSMVDGAGAITYIMIQVMGYHRFLVIDSRQEVKYKKDNNALASGSNIYGKHLRHRGSYKSPVSNPAIFHTVPGLVVGMEEKHQ